MTVALHMILEDISRSAKQIEEVKGVSDANKNLALERLRACVIWLEKGRRQ